MVANLQIIKYDFESRDETLNGLAFGDHPIVLTRQNPFGGRSSHAESVSPRSGLAYAAGLGMNAPLEVDADEI